MLKVSTRPLTALAHRLTGRSVTVEIGHELRGERADGYAVRLPSGGYAVRLNPLLWQLREPERLASTFFHELAHIRAGDCDTRAPQAGPVTRAQVNAANDYAAADAVQRRRESAADAWAAEMVRKWPPRVIWELTCEGE